MTHPTPDQETTALMGAVTAPTTHDLMNVLAIIGEHAGLLADLLHLGGTGALSAEQLGRGIAAIEAQVARGRTLLAHLNRLAHAPDPNPAPQEIGAVTAELVALTQRRFHGRLTAPPAGHIVPCDPMRLRLLIFRLLEAASHPTQTEETPVTVALSGPALHITIGGHHPPAHPDALAALAAELGATLSCHHHTLDLSFPATN